MDNKSNNKPFISPYSASLLNAAVSAPSISPRNTNTDFLKVQKIETSKPIFTCIWHLTKRYNMINISRMPYASLLLLMLPFILEMLSHLKSTGTMHVPPQH